jgi:signal transduction histidine kinase
LLFRLILADPIKEQKELCAQKIIASMLTIFENESTRILTLTEDWASWDSMYDYVSQPISNRGFLKDLLPRLMLKDADLSFFLVVNKKKEIIHLEGYDNIKREYIPFDLLKQKKDSLWGYLLKTFHVKKSTSGIVQSEYGSMLMVSSPVLHSDNSGPQNGRLLMGRFIDQTFEKRIASSIREKTYFLKYPPKQKHPQAWDGQMGNANFMLEEGADHMIIHYPVKDVENQYAFTIQVKAQTQIFEILGKATRLFFLLLIAGFLLFGVISYFFIHRLVVRRVKCISEETDKIVSLDDLSLRVPMAFRDEITLLSRNINKMLQRLQTENLRREAIEHMLALNEKLIFLGKVTSNIAHEVNNPLFAIANSLKLLKKHLPTDTNNERLHEAVQMAGKEIQRVRTITQNLHQFTIQNIEEPALSDITTIMKAAIKVTKWSKQLKDTVIEFKTQNFSFPLYCNPETLQQVFMNMILNAVEAMDGKGKLFIDVTKEDEEYRIDFIDNGPGCSDDIKAAIFAPFQTTKFGKGSGLGLYISNNIIINHGGTITLNESYKKGAHLIIRIPKRGGPFNEPKASTTADR